MAPGPLAKGLALMLVFIIVLAGYFLTQSRTLLQERIDDSAESMTRVIERYAYAELHDSDVFLQRWAATYQRAQHQRSYDEGGFVRAVIEDLQHYPAIASVQISDARGDILFGSGGERLERPINIADREYFAQVREHNRLAISLPLLGRISRKIVIPLARPLIDAQGRFAGVIEVNLQAKDFLELFASLGKDNRNTFLFFDADASIGLRYPEPKGPGSAIGLRIGSPEFHDRWWQQGLRSATYRARSTTDGARRIYNYRPIGDYPLYVMVGVAEDDLLTFWRYQVAAVCGFILIFLFLTVYILRQQARDTLRRRRDEDELRVAASVYNTSREGIVITDARARIIAVNPAFTALSGYAASDAIGRNPRFFKSRQQSADTYRDIWRQIGTHGQWSGELWSRRKNGKAYLAQLSVAAERASDGTISRYVGVFLDITEQRARDQAIWHNANFDALTGLPNRRLFMDRLEQDIKKVRRTGQRLALLFLDLDEFKEINDTLGHAKGDGLLVEAAERISRSVRASDTVARLGGDEFTVILPAPEGSDAVDRVAHAVLVALAQPFSLGGDDTAELSASIGITVFPDDTEDLPTLVRNADQAMYAAKQAGRNQVCYFTPAMQESALNKRRMLQDLRRARVQQEFSLHFQPIVEAGSGSIAKVEALLRWHHPTRGTVAPLDFIPLCEASGLIVEIGDWVIEHAVDALAGWRAAGATDQQVCINVSPVQLLKCDARRWIQYISSREVPPSRVVIEITESVLMIDAPRIRETLQDFQQAGIEVALDDFGTGFSALSYLHRFDVDYLKIDASFVAGLSQRASNQSLIEAMVVMAHKLGLKTVAEGVETQEQARILREQGCDYLQGYLFSKPVPAAEITARLIQAPV